jgi:hypothetical protein
VDVINSLNAELNPICDLLALLGAHHILHISRIRVNHRATTKGELVLHAARDTKIGGSGRILPVITVGGQR